MKNLQKYHSLIIFLSYVIILTIKPISYIDAFIVSFLAGYIGLSFFMQYQDDKQERLELEDKVNKLEEAFKTEIEKVVGKQDFENRRVDQEVKELKNKVTSMNIPKSVGMNTRF